MMIHSAKASANVVGLRVAGAVAGTLAVLLALLAVVRPEMMGMLHRLMSAAGN